MKKTFDAINDVGIKVRYTILAITEEAGEKYVIYTNFISSDNELGVRLMAAKVINDETFEIEKIAKAKEYELIESFKLEMISSGKKIRRVADEY